jgi:hypothetical protein
MGFASFEKSRGRRAQITFGMNTNVFDEEAVPSHALAARMQVKTAKVQARLGPCARAGWNQSVVPDNFKTFPERPLMRTLSKFDSHKRADYNFRAEVLDSTDRKMYVPAGDSKFEYSERHILSADQQAAAPPSLARTEHCVHPDLAGMPRWDASTGDAGDPYAARKARERQAQTELDAAIRNSQRRAPTRRLGLLAEYQVQLEQQRAAKLERRKLEAAGIAWTRASWTAPISEVDALEMSRSVPARKVTTWSLGSI